MGITLKRSTGWQGSAGKMKILLDGEKAGEILEKKSLRLELPGREAVVSVRQGGMKSPEIKVRDGDLVKITMNRWHRMNMPVLFAGFLGLSFLTDMKTRIILIVIFGFFMFLSLYAIKGYHLEIEEKQPAGRKRNQKA